MTTTTAIIGLDGLAPADFEDFELPGDWDTLDVETVAHTCPSWNAIFTGRDRAPEGVFDFFRLPPDPEDVGGMLAAQSDERWTYSDLKTDAYLWERFPDVTVVSAPVCLPTFSTLADPPGLPLTWCGNGAEVEQSIERLTELTLSHETVITVFPTPDKMNHLVDNAEKPYSPADRRRHMDALADAVTRLVDAFDEWVFLSDHGRPCGREHPVPDSDLWVPSHETTGVIRSNTVGTTDLTNVSVYETLVSVLSESG